MLNFFSYLEKKTPNFWEENLYVKKKSITFQYKYFILVQFFSIFL